MTTMFYKYPKTFHVPWSRSVDESDRVLTSVEQFVGKQVIVSAKLDGECTTFYRDHIHARSIDSKHHVSRYWVKALQASIRHNIPENWRICGENMFAEHSIHYNNLDSYFYVFSIWNDKNISLDWEEVKIWCQLLGLYTVPVLYEGIWNEQLIKNLYTPTFDGCELEGYVIRNKNSFHYDDFNKNVAKFVRKNHVGSDKDFWRNKIIQNELRKHE